MPENHWPENLEEAISELLGWLDKEFTPMPQQVRSLIAAAPDTLAVCRLIDDHLETARKAKVQSITIALDGFIHREIKSAISQAEEVK